VRRLKAVGLFSKLALIEPNPAPIEWVEAAHSPGYAAIIERKIKSGAANLDADTPVCARSYDAALLAAGGILCALDEVMAGRIASAFCAVRPPGHHAARHHAMGFCIFNNVAIGAKYLLKRYNLDRVLIVDWDVHHGNGTQDIFYDDKNVLYFSTHQYPHYPGTGSREEAGSGDGEGYTINLPLPSGCGDEEYIEAFEKILVPAAKKFKPQFVLISAGFDAHKDDPLASMNVTEEGFKALTSIVSKIAHEYSGGRIVSALEGGYNLLALARSATAHIVSLME